MSTSAGDALVRRWVGRRAGEELERLRREKMRSIDTREAVRQIFGSALPAIPAPPTSGLVEQQAWFAKIHRAGAKCPCRQAEACRTRVIN
jgi:hypothetical protein